MREVTDWRELLPTAFLLAGSDAGARDLLVRGLARGGGVDGLVRAHLRRRLGREVVLTGTAADPWWLSPADAEAAAALAAGLDGLTRAERAAVVLHWFEDLPADEVATRAPGVDLSTLPDRLGVAVDDLPARLELLAGTARPADVDDAVVAREVRAVRVRRVTRPLLAVATVAALVTGAVLLPRSAPTPAPPAVASASPGSLSPPRGSLVDDEDLVDALLARSPGQQLVYAGDAVGRRWVLLVDRGTASAEVSWFTGPAGADAADLVEDTAGYSGYLPQAWSIAVGDERGAAALVVARDGDRVEVSGGVDVLPDGRTTRAFQPVGSPDGVSAVRLDRPGSTGVQYRVVRDGRVVGTESPMSGGGRVEPATPVDGPRSGVGPVDPFAYSLAVEQVTRPTGRLADDLDVVVLGAGSFPAPGGATAQAVTVAVTLPGGAVATSTATATGDLGDVCGTETHPAGTDPATLTVATRCASYAGDSSTFGATLLVVAPPGGQVVLDSGAGGTPATPTLDQGWAYVVDGVDALDVFAADGVTGTVSRAGNGPFDHA